MTTLQKLVIAVACLVAIALRLNLPGFPNFGALVALSLLCGSVCGRSWAFLIPIGVRTITDVALEWHTAGHGYFASWPFDYSAYILIALLGSRVSSKSVWQISAATMSSVVIYFLVSNCGVWYCSGSDSYPKTASGLLLCLDLGLPFSKATMYSNLVFAPAFFGLWQWATSRSAQAAAELPTVLAENSGS